MIILKPRQQCPKDKEPMLLIRCIGCPYRKEFIRWNNTFKVECLGDEIIIKEIISHNEGL